MSSVQVADETFVAASTASVPGVVGDRSRWSLWWPDLRLEVVEDRGEAGVRWRVGGALTGTMEIWCKPELDGFVLHYFLHAEPTNGTDGRARAGIAETHRRRVAGRRMSTEVKRRLENGRAAGGPARGFPAVTEGA
ncbi:hypothetical protein [Williamsia deligens]|uniref:Polyketide cyclase / dehydrase and lipid transport n=1 Tax=Williamsia deligens TaxID=321325 RepID=A0ABW3GEF4_9NOCA|nr:hypothetical protein [Williamsia deligens]